MNVGVIFHDPALTPVLAEALRARLMALQRPRAVVRVLHHAGRADADATAVRIAGELGEWQDRAHPDGDIGVVGASDIVVAVGPRRERDADSSARAVAWVAAVRHARASRVHLVFLPEPAGRAAPGKPAKAPGQPAARRPTSRNVGAPQPSLPSGGRRAGRAGRVCRRCGLPVPASRERWGWLCEKCERPPRLVHADLRAFPALKSKSVRAVSAGLPGLGKRS